MPILPAFTDWILIVLLRDVARYRFRVIRNNLRETFHYASEEELKADINSYYKSLARVLREFLSWNSVKLLQKRLHLAASPQIDIWLAENKGIIVLMGHIGNWEWAGGHLSFIYPGRVCALYKRIKSERVNRFFIKRRASSGIHLIETSKMGDLIRLIKTRPMMIYMISDQNPGNDQGIIWVPFLSRETAFASGPESIATKYKLPVVYLNILPIDNITYKMEFKIISAGEELLPAGEITKRYAQLLESNIHAYRTGWLWSHRRWKRTRK